MYFAIAKSSPSLSLEVDSSVGEGGGGWTAKTVNLYPSSVTKLASILGMSFEIKKCVFIFFELQF